MKEIPSVDEIVEAIHKSFKKGDLVAVNVKDNIVVLNKDELKSAIKSVLNKNT